MESVTALALPRRALVMGAVIALITLSVAAGQVKVAEVLAAGLCGYILALALVNVLGHWSWLIYGLGAIDIMIPEDDRYTLHGTGSTGFQLEPYRIMLMVMVLGWIAAIMVDPRVKPRKTKFGGPLLLISAAMVGSEVFNAGRVDVLSSFVLKALFLVVFLFGLVFVLASVIDKRKTIDRLLAVLVAAGCVEGIGAIIQRVTPSRFNIFDHMHRILPMFTFNLSAESGAMLRNGHFRAVSSAGHPIELSCVMAMLTPLAAYVAIRTGRKIWWGAIPILILGNLSSGSRTGMIGLLVVLLVFVSLRPRQTLSCWPALIPTLLVIQIVMPGAISGTISAFFPKGGLLAQQSQTFASHGQVQQASRLSRLGPQLSGVFAKHNEFFGEGYGTRVIGRTSTTDTTLVGSAQAAAQDNAQILDDQWLGNLLDTGLVGFVAWLWLFIRVIRRLVRRARLERGTTEGWLPVALCAAIACYMISAYFYDAWGFIQGSLIMLMLLGCSSALLYMPLPSPVGDRRLIMPRVGRAADSAGRAPVHPVPAPRPAVS